MKKMVIAAALGAVVATVAVAQQQPDWKTVEDETMRHFQAVLRIDTQNPPGNETGVAEYVKQVLDKEGIPAQLIAADPKRANVVARLKGNGRKRPLLIMGHSDVVTVDAAKWKHPPFSATREGGWLPPSEIAIGGRKTTVRGCCRFVALTGMVEQSVGGEALFERGNEWSTVGEWQEGDRDRSHRGHSLPPSRSCAVISASATSTILRP